ncbi:MAG: 50S ribosomal protein L18 [Pseudomonadota bacterium]
MRSSRCRFETRKQRVRSAIARLSDRPRLSVFKSGRHIYAQIIDDNKAITLVSASTQDKELKSDAKSCCNKISAEKVGALVGKRAAAKGITKIVFDKGGYKYHGVIQALADAARKELEF